VLKDMQNLGKKNFDSETGCIDFLKKVLDDLNGKLSPLEV